MPADDDKGVRPVRVVPQASTGRAPGRAEKEALRPLYVRYWRLKRALAEASSSGPTAPASPRPAMRSIMMEA